MSDPYILMWLEAPMQSWGFDSKFGVRNTAGFPTKSGVIGLLCCGMGAGGEQEELLAELAPLDMQIVSYVRKDEIPEPLLSDFHMVGSGYDEADPWQKLCIPKAANGNRKPNANIITHRSYLQDAAFAVAIQVPKAKLNQITDGLINPVWDLYLGRKSCAPTDFIYRGYFSSAEEALLSADEIGTSTEKGRVKYKSSIQGEGDYGEVLLINDVPVRFGENKKYSSRWVTVSTFE